MKGAGGRLALPAGHWGRVLVEARHPNIELVSCADESDCAARFAAGRAEATLVQLPPGLAVTGVVEELRAEEFIALGGSRRELVPRAAEQPRARYLSFLAHEVRNTLGGITGAVRLLEERHDADFAERLLPSLHRSAAGTLQLLDDLLDQGRLDAGHLPL
ncbi:MAG: histidine kinase dimerization/phospho-acceptor domain-containing protein [Rubrivivax sp.]